MNDSTRITDARFTDAERFRVLVRLINDRLTVLDTRRAAGEFTAADARENDLLRDLLQMWVLEKRQE